jgi:hypothetical protein
MITKNTFFRIFGTLSLFTFIVSCTSNNDDMVATNKKANTNRESAFVSDLPHGKLIFENTSPFNFNGSFNCYGVGATGDLDTNIDLGQELYIPNSQTTTLVDYDTAFSLGYAEKQWGMGNNGVSSIISNADANILHRQTDVSGLYKYVNWKRFKGSGFIPGTSTSAGFYYDYNPVTASFGIIADQENIPYDINSDGVDDSCVLVCTVIVLPNGDTKVRINLQLM